MLEFASAPAFLLLAVPVLLRALLRPGGGVGARLLVPDGLGQRLLGHGRAMGQSQRPDGLIPWLIWGLLVLAIAGPRQLQPTPALPTSGRDLVVALDLSGSMVRDDFALNGQKLTRLEAVQLAGAEFLRRRGGDRVGLIVFGSEAYFASPLSFDVEAVAVAVETAVIGISGRATNISGALGLALKRLSRSPADSRVVILLSDGANNAGAATPRDVARLAADMGIRVHTIAMGPEDLDSAPDTRGVVDAATLGAMADLSGGAMFRVRNTDDLLDVMAAIDALEPTQRAGLAAETYREFWIYPAILAGILCLFHAARRRV